MLYQGGNGSFTIYWQTFEGVESALDTNESFEYDAKRFHDDVYGRRETMETLQKRCNPISGILDDTDEARLQSYRLCSTK